MYFKLLLDTILVLQQWESIANVLLGKKYKLCHNSISMSCECQHCYLKLSYFMNEIQVLEQKADESVIRLFNNCCVYMFKQTCLNAKVLILYLLLFNTFPNSVCL